jgi:Trm5-related predicted tRNA methylase
VTLKIKTEYFFMWLINKKKISYHYPIFNIVNMDMHSTQHKNQVTVVCLQMLSEVRKFMM